MKDLVSRCPIEEVMQVLSGRWPTLLIYYLQEGTKRFSDLRRDNPTISHKMLTLELRKLEDAGIVRRTEFDGYPLRVEYDLTPAGERLVPLIDALGDWWERSTGNVGNPSSLNADMADVESAQPRLPVNRVSG
ncbi:helix-turn-helix transcriptional regulator [Brucella intermedia]|uniref:winged helix-turn-helix transcriptional regulator n=1 Tax=Brucella intermedia TaxID=94625 RepID=UPI00209ADF56|nr:helix-turn-helix domain-containing protein [Brucella intermedia]MCO7728866.1 helix-turn-helix transcriptional regulator [Brucella intermedia]